MHSGRSFATSLHVCSIWPPDSYLFTESTDKRKATWAEENPDGRWRCYDYEDLLKRDKLSLDLFWIKDRSLTDTESLPAPGIIATEIADELETALEQFTKITARLNGPR